MASRPDLKLEIGFGAGVFQLTADVDWTDVTSRLRGDTRGIAIRRGRAGDTGAVDPGRMSLALDNRDGALTPDDPGAAYWPNVQPTRRIRLSARLSDGDPWTPLFTGYIRAWQPASGRGGRDAIVDLDCIDLLAVLSRYRITTSSASSTYDLNVISNALSTAGVPSGDWDLQGDPGVTRTRIVRPAQTNVPIADWTRRVTLTADALLFVAADGNVTYHTRGWRQVEKNVAAVFANDAGVDVWVLGQSDLGINTVLRDSGWTAGDGDGVWYESLAWSFDDARMVNLAQITRDGGTLQEASDSTSRLWYGDYALTETGLILYDDTVALARAQWRVVMGAYPQLRAETLSFAGAIPADTWTALLGIELDTLLDVRQMLVDSGDSLRRLVRVGGITHDITPSDWRVTLKLEPEAAKQALILDDATYGVLDSGVVEGY